MVDVIRFKEPERCDYLYIDENNKVHLLMPIVGGDEIGLDNTCQTSVELRSFFYGSTRRDEARHSAEQQLTDYKKNLEADIQAINNQKGITRNAYAYLLLEKKERLKQIEKYIELIKVLKEEYDNNGEIIIIKKIVTPPLPAGLNQIIQSSENAGAVRLSPENPDLATSFKNPLFRLNRHYETSDYKLTEGLGVRLSSTLLPDPQTPTPINRKSPKEKIAETVLAKFQSEKIAEPDREKKLKELKALIQEELVKIDSNLSVDISHDKKETNYDYMDMIMGVDEDSSIAEWVDSILAATVDSSVWDTQSSSPFYDGSKKIEHKGDADRMSIRVQFLLAEANFYCKTNKLSDANFGEFFDKEPHASEIAKRVKEGLVQGVDIEPIIYNYINSNHADLGLKSPLTGEQQQEVTNKFTQHYNTIKDSPHFDEFFIADPDKKGNIFTHQGRLSCHFLDFFARQTRAKHLLGELEGHSEALQKGTSNRLSHKNEIVGDGELLVINEQERTQSTIDFALQESYSKEALAASEYSIEKLSTVKSTVEQEEMAESRAHELATVFQFQMEMKKKARLPDESFIGMISRNILNTQTDTYQNFLSQKVNPVIDKFFAALVKKDYEQLEQVLREFPSDEQWAPFTSEESKQDRKRMNVIKQVIGEGSVMLHRKILPALEQCKDALEKKTYPPLCKRFTISHQMKT